MATIKEKREQFLQKKLKEMADKGKNESRSDNRPFFDPISTETEEVKEEDIVVSEKKEKKEKKVESESKGKYLFSDYKEQYLSYNKITKRTNFIINMDTLQVIKDVLNDLGENISIAGYIDNILIEHLKEYRELLNETTSKRRRKITIPNE